MPIPDGTTVVPAGSVGSSMLTKVMIILQCWPKLHLMHMFVPPSRGPLETLSVLSL